MPSAWCSRAGHHWGCCRRSAGTGRLSATGGLPRIAPQHAGRAQHPHRRPAHQRPSSLVSAQLPAVDGHGCLRFWLVGVAALAGVALFGRAAQRAESIWLAASLGGRCHLVIPAQPGASRCMAAGVVGAVCRRVSGSALITGSQQSRGLLISSYKAQTFNTVG